MIVSNPVNIQYLTNLQAEGILVLTRKDNIYITDGRYIEYVNKTLTILIQVKATTIKANNATPLNLTTSYGASSTAVTLSGDNAGTFSIATASDTTIATATLSGSIITVTPVKPGTTKVVAKEANGNSSYEELCTTASRAWHMKKTQIERESSLYCCLSLRSKLQLMGLDYCTEREIQELGLYAYSQKAYWEYVASDDMPQNSMGEGQQPNIIFSDLNFKQSRRRTMAIHEHMRWNSYMLSKGMIPATIKQIEELEVDDKGRYINGKNYPLRRHGNLTTFEGLVEFRRIVGKKPDTDEKNEDVIRYDYQILDDAYWLLRTQGYKIVDKKALQEARKNKQKEQEKSKTVAIS
jgi:hypothetical protein